MIGFQYKVVIDDSTPIAPPPPGRGMGLIPRDFALHAVGSAPDVPTFNIPLIPRSEWKDRLAALKGNQLTDYRMIGMGGKPIPSRDQGRKGYCWAHSTTSGMLLSRCASNQPYSDLSAYMIACIIKNYRDLGGFGLESTQFVAANGIADSKHWPQQSMSRSNDNPAMRADAKTRRVTEYMDLDPSDPLYVDQFVTCLLLNIPVVSDFNWWGHSVCTAALLDVDPTATTLAALIASLRTVIWNSWGDGWGDLGMGELRGRRALPSSAIAQKNYTASAA